MKIIFQIGKILLCLAVLSFIGGCGIWQELHFTKNKPQESDLVGIYEPDAKTRNLIIKDGGYPSANCQIKLNADREIELINMPDWWENGFGESHKRLVSTKGIWKLEKVQGRWGIDWETENVTHGVNLIGQKPPYKIHIYVGDPDSDCFMIFERTTN
ncbi:MAG TPA: hypothetical protein VN784_05820 [Candidatus Limnocylindrales bacterium]|nr:hypothetical protein [Candidatus Limnocylindrales bacterium]